VKSMLYWTHLPWGWIKQRPHFIAENLAGSYDVTICCKKNYHIKNLTNEKSPANIPFWEIFALPFCRIGVMNLLTKLLIHRQMRTRINNFDIIWINHPAMFYYVREIIKPETHLVYDCMDDSLEFPVVKSDRKKTFRLKKLEEGLLARADTVFVSSAHLKDVICSRYNSTKKMNLLNNGIDQIILGRGQVKPATESIGNIKEIPLKKIMYLGTIAGWIDFDLILKSLEELDDIVYILVGPIEVVVPTHDRIVLISPVEHSQVFNLMEMADVLVMPFVVTDLVRSVNPVKVYEYIYSGKPSLVVNYSETLQFRQFVTLYDDGSDYIRKLKSILNGNEVTKTNVTAQAQHFIADNTWEKRVADINKVLESKP